MSEQPASRSIAVGGDGNIVVAGTLNGNADFGSGLLIGAGGGDVFVAKLDPSGGPAWAKSFGDAAAQIGWHVAADAAGNVAVSGELSGSADFGGGALLSAGQGDIFVAKLAQ